VDYSYWDDEQLRAVTQGNTTLASYTYDTAGRLQQLTRANGAVTTYGYDGADRLRDLRTVASGADVSRFQYQVDRLGQRTAVTESLPPQSRTVSYSYDGLLRLTGAVENPGTTYAYSYDLAGNRTEVRVNGAVTESRSYDAADQVGGWQYDAAGNLLSDGTTSYTYDALNHALTVAAGNQQRSYSYNGDGTLMQQIANGITTRFTQDLQASFSQVLQTTQGISTTDYVYGTDRLAALDGMRRTWYQGDALGSIRQTLDDTGLSLTTLYYDPWGTPEGGTKLNTFGFTGEIQDGALGLVYLRTRWYQPGQGTFTTLDSYSGPLSLDLPAHGFSNPNELNRYRYASSNPIILVDHSGLAPRVDCAPWPWYLNDLCQPANGPDNDVSALRARHAFYRRIIYGSWIRGLGSGGEGFGWASAMLEHFLYGNGRAKTIVMRADGAFANDPGITRATREFRGPASPDEADRIEPLLPDFLNHYVAPVAQNSNSTFSLRRILLKGKDHYFNRPGKTLGLEPRARDRGFWAAFGHVTIDGSFAADGRRRTNGYIINYRAGYTIKDRYEWFRGKWTPFDFPQGKGTVWIPHEWALSLVAQGLAREYDFTISWGEEGKLFTSDFNHYRSAGWWE
jgi:RHS repeat-associated protein